MNSYEKPIPPPHEQNIITKSIPDSMTGTFYQDEELKRFVMSKKICNNFR